MIYQKLLVGKQPYFTCVSEIGHYPIHRHPEFELLYCVNGEYSLVLAGKSLSIREGELAVVKPMESHEIIECAKDGRMLVVNFGPLMLDDFFEPLLAFSFDSVIYKLKEDCGECGLAVAELLDGLVALRANKTSFSELSVRGNIYKIAALLPSLASFSEKESSSVKNLKDIAKVDRAMSVIYEQYRSHIDLEYVSALCGYSKSNFCKIFKTITGDTFHTVLNAHRIEIAKMHLKGSDLPVEDIASEVGFSDAKSFCRVFKRITGRSPGAYRKSRA